LSSEGLSAASKAWLPDFMALRVKAAMLRWKTPLHAGVRIRFFMRGIVGVQGLHGSCRGLRGRALTFRWAMIHFNHRPMGTCDLPY
jgi:hypothetical protein